MKIILLGTPGAGKGTQAGFIAKKHHIPLISTGDMLRAAIRAGTPLGQMAQKIMEKGDLVSDEVIISLVKERVSRDDCRDGYLLDGYPRTISQALALQKENVHIDHVIEIYVPDHEVVKRLGGRWSHIDSGRVYHEIHNPPQKAGLDDITNEPLVQRDDDKKETILERLRVYHEKTEPLVEHYATSKQGPHYVRVDGIGSVEEIHRRILSALQASPKHH
jgi:adenylate kinase